MEQNGSSALQALWGHLAKPRPPWTHQPSAVSRVGRCGGGEGADAGQGPPAGILPWGDDTPSDAPQRRDVRPLPRGQWGRPDRQCWGRLPGCGSCACAQRRGAGGWRQDAGHWLVSGCSARAVLLNGLLIYVQGSVFKGWSSALR